MSDSRRVVEGVALERLRTVVVQRRAEAAIWRAFLVAQVSVRAQRRREMTTQRLFLFGHRK